MATKTGSVHHVEGTGKGGNAHLYFVSDCNDNETEHMDRMRTLKHLRRMGLSADEAKEAVGYVTPYPNLPFVFQYDPADF